MSFNLGWLRRNHSQKARLGFNNTGSFSAMARTDKFVFYLQGRGGCIPNKTQQNRNVEFLHVLLNLYHPYITLDGYCNLERLPIRYGKMSGNERQKRAGNFIRQIKSLR